MKNNSEIIQKCSELTETIQEAKKRKLTKSQDLALKFAFRIESVSRNIIFLVDAGADIEAHAICRLLFEHCFNCCALLNDEQHYEVLFGHAKGEPGRQLKKIMQGHNKNPTLTSENIAKANEYLSHPDRENDPKNGLNWEQISHSGGVDCLYTAYKQYSFSYAHSTAASILIDVSAEDLEQLRENVWTVLELVRLFIRSKIINTANKEK